MLKKESMIPGSKVKLRSALKDGMPAAFGGSMPMPNLWLMQNHYSYPKDWQIDVPPNSTLTVIHGPKKKNGINCAKVNYNGKDGFMFWSMLRASADHI